MLIENKKFLKSFYAHNMYFSFTTVKFSSLLNCKFYSLSDLKHLSSWNLRICLILCLLMIEIKVSVWY